VLQITNNYTDVVWFSWNLWYSFVFREKMVLIF